MVLGKINQRVSAAAVPASAAATTAANAPGGVLDASTGRVMLPGPSLLSFALALLPRRCLVLLLSRAPYLSRLFCRSLSLSPSLSNSFSSCHSPSAGPLMRESTTARATDRILSPASTVPITRPWMAHHRRAGATFAGAADVDTAAVARDHTTAARKDAALNEHDEEQDGNDRVQGVHSPHGPFPEPFLSAVRPTRGAQALLG
mmetsp:Transcript_16258/g.39963  ORF Transcript_16258/g.39963 Transcript_16258/m.39963 type:complete len:203 (+) Transcript_16258:643-1251(+)